MANCPFNPASQSVADFLYRYGSLQNELADTGRYPCQDIISSDYAVAYMPLAQALPLSLRRYPYYSIPGLFTLLDDSAMEAAGITAAAGVPALSSQGRGVLIGLVDTGIDYTNPLFRRSDGSTRIAGIWDQTLSLEEDASPPGVPEYYPQSAISYGTEFTQSQINEALSSPQPYELVPSRDDHGHGTYLAGLAAGNAVPEQAFAGAAPQAELVVVKLKPAKQYLRDFYLVASGVPAYQENDIMLGIKYLRVTAARLRRPLVILLALGSNSGSHEGTSPLSLLFQSFSGYFGIVPVIAAGNETGLGHHYLGSIPQGQEYEDAELRVGEEDAARGFVLELWASNADTYAVGFTSPSGERIGRIPIISNNETSIPFLLETTTITVNYQLIEAGSGRQLIFMRFQTPSPGIWKIRVYNTKSLTGRFHLWLPSRGLISDETAFLRPNPFNTITLPGNASSAITVAAYNHANNSLYIHSSRGYAVNGVVKPDLAAPGVDVYGPAPSGGRGSSRLSLTSRSGTSAAAAIAAGAAACLLSWGIVEGNDPTMGEIAVKSYLTRGADRLSTLTYPNEEWGYGALNLFQTFLSLRE